MCTVTFIPCGNKIYITHNRDEKSIRSLALPPRQYTVHGHRLLFPKDSQAGGTWIAVNEHGSIAVLLNGAFVNHSYKPPYKRSRGLVLLDIVAAADLYISFTRAALEGIEPFTVIIWNSFSLYQCHWDGIDKHIKELDPTQCYTWSSVTLYDDTILAKRKQWFEQWQQHHIKPSMQEIIRYHLLGGDGDNQNDLRMNRNGQMLTVSITGIELEPGKCNIQYLDLQENKTYLSEMNFTKAGVIKQ